LLVASQALPWWGHESGHVIAAAMPAVAVLLTAVGHGALTLVKRTRANRWLKGTFGRYLAPSVIEALGRDPSLIKLGGRRRRLTLLFSDLAGFTTMARKMEPDQVVDLLNRYLSMHAGAVLAEGGVVDKFIGDAVMAFWGDPLEQSDHAARACRTALAVLRAMPDVERYATRYGLEGFHARIGIHTGPAVVGNMGSSDRQDYTCIGDTVNLASRLEGASTPYGVRVLVSRATRERAGDDFAWRLVDRIAVKGKHVSEAVYEPLGRVGDVDEVTLAFARTYEKAFAAYQARQFREATEILRTVPAGRAKDPSVAHLLQLCHWYLDEAPPPDWDGVARLAVK